MYLCVCVIEGGGGASWLYMYGVPVCTCVCYRGRRCKQQPWLESTTRFSNFDCWKWYTVLSSLNLLFFVSEACSTFSQADKRTHDLYEQTVWFGCPRDSCHKCWLIVLHTIGASSETNTLTQVQDPKLKSNESTVSTTVIIFLSFFFIIKVWNYIGAIKLESSRILKL